MNRRSLPWATAATIALVALSVAASQGPAGADCSGPMVARASAPVDRGAVVALVGTGWGDQCYDTGPPPPGQGSLGVPVRDVEIVIAQGATEVVVARVDADARYELHVEATIPATLEPGPALVIGRAGAGATRMVSYPSRWRCRPSPRAHRSSGRLRPRPPRRRPRPRARWPRRPRRPPPRRPVARAVRGRGRWACWC